MAIECRKAVLALAAAAVLGGCGDGRRAAAVSEPDEVYVAAPISRPVEIWDDFTARIEAVKSVEVRARVDGYLEKVNFSEGQLVEEGDLLFVIDRRPYLAKAAAARAGVEEIEARLALARTNLERAKNMYDANAISKICCRPCRGGTFLAAVFPLARGGGAQSGGAECAGRM